MVAPLEIATTNSDHAVVGEGRYQTGCSEQQINGGQNLGCVQKYFDKSTILGKSLKKTKTEDGWGLRGKKMRRAHPLTGNLTRFFDSSLLTNQSAEWFDSLDIFLDKLIPR